jgi:hypothetical protein
MAAVRKLQTQTESFWRDEYEVSPKDLDLLTNLTLEAGKPQRLTTLAAAIITRRLQLEREAMARRAKSGHLYQPLGHYEVGQELVFTALDFAVGKVMTVRPGHNPKYGPFEAIRVSFGADVAEREFAAAFAHPHPLNQPAEELLGGTDAGLSESELVRLFEHYVARRLGPALEKSEDFIACGGQWFLRAMLPDMHIGYLNLAEAMIYEARHPLAAREMLAGLDIKSTSAPEAQLFALNQALSGDTRFDNVSTTEDAVWYLRALQPAAVFERPAVLTPAFRALGGELLGITMLDMVEEVGDDLDDLETMTFAGAANGVHCELSFPHLYAGTMPATLRFLHLLPSGNNQRMPVTLVDGRTGSRFEAWVVPDEGYICGLGDWYAAVEMGVGGQVALTTTEEPFTFALAITPLRGKRGEWIRSASVADNTLVLQMQRANVEVRCDRNMLIDVPDRDAVARLAARPEIAALSLNALVRKAFNELSKLSGRGLVHAKSVYSVANLMRRTGAVPILAELTRRACYDPVGDGFWAYDPSVEGTVYRTPEEMRERPASQREDLVRDQVVQYLGR